jgi:hypothetical protein
MSTDRLSFMPVKLFGLLWVFPSRGVAFIYGSALSGWIYLLTSSGCRLVGGADETVGAICVAVVAALIFVEVARLRRAPLDLR